jgi:hypothetical protein
MTYWTCCASISPQQTIAPSPQPCNGQDGRRQWEPRHSRHAVDFIIAFAPTSFAHRHPSVGCSCPDRGQNAFWWQVGRRENPGCSPTLRSLAFANCSTTSNTRGIRARFAWSCFVVSHSTALVLYLKERSCFGQLAHARLHSLLESSSARSSSALVLADVKREETELDQTIASVLASQHSMQQALRCSEQMECEDFFEKFFDSVLSRP